MQEKVESGAASAPPGGTLALGLALRHGLRQRALLTSLPFLALGRRRRPRTENEARGLDSPSAMPWPTPGLFGWPTHPPGEPGAVRPDDAASGQTFPSAASGQMPHPETLAALVPMLRWAGRGSGGPTHAGSSAAPTRQPLAALVPMLRWAGRGSGGPTHAGSSAAPTRQPLAALVPMLRWTSRGSGAPPHARSNAPGRPAPLARVWQPMAAPNLKQDRPALAIHAPSSPFPRPATTIQAGALAGKESRIQRSPADSAPLSDGSLAERVGARVDTAGTRADRLKVGTPTPASNLTPHLPMAAPMGNLLNVLPGLALGAGPTAPPVGAAGRSPSPQRLPHKATWGQATPSRPPLPPVPGRAFVAPLVWPNTPNPTRAQTLLSGRTPHAGHEPGPYAPTSLQGLTAIAGAIEHLVEREVKAEVRRQREETQSPASRPDAANSPPAVDVTSDEVVRLLMRKMRTLAREERFRLGQLR